MEITMFYMSTSIIINENTIVVNNLHTLYFASVFVKAILQHVLSQKVKLYQLLNNSTLISNIHCYSNLYI